MTTPDFTIPEVDVEDFSLDVTPEPQPINPLPENYADGNSYVESLGGVNLLAQEDPGEIEEIEEESDLPELNPLTEHNFYDEQRRVAALATAQTLGLDTVGKLLDAAQAIETWLTTGDLPDDPA